MRKLVFLMVTAMVVAVGVPAAAVDDPLEISEDTMLAGHNGQIVIVADNVTLDCQGSTISGTGQFFGVGLFGRTGVTVKNCIVSGFEDGFAVVNSSRNTLVGNTSHNNNAGFVLGDSHKNTLKDNEAYENVFAGFALFSSSGNTLVGNSAYDNTWYGFGLENASGNTLKDNTASGDQVAGFFVGSFEEPSSSSGNLLTHNTATENRSTDDEGAGDGFSLVNATGNILRANSANDNASVGIALNGSFDNTVKDNSASGNEYAGFYVLEGASGNTLKGNYAERNDNGYLLEFYSFNNILKDNEAFDNDDFGFFLHGSFENTLKDNVADGVGAFYFEDIVDAGFPANDQAVVGNVLKGNTGCSDVGDYESTNTFKDNDFSC